MRNEKAALRYSGEAAYEKPPTTPQSITEGNPRSKFTAARRLRPAGDDLALVLAADLAAVFGREAPEVSLTALGQAIILEGQRREARP